MRGALLSILRATHLINAADAIAAQRAASRARAENEAYRALHHTRAFPDPRLIYEVAGHAKLAQFDQTGARHAALIARMLEEAGAPPGARVLEWGCGPARILAHLEQALPQARLHGCDPHAGAIAFAKAAHPSIAFARSEATPPAPYASETFDAIYGISIFTHLSEGQARAWSAELARLVTSSGVVIVTTHGETAATRLNGRERAAFDAGHYVVRGGAPVGTRTFAAYVSKEGGRGLFGRDFTDIAFTPAALDGFGQDVWVLKRPRSA